MMTINEFIEHLKHNTLGLQICEDNTQSKKEEIVFNGCVGSWKNWKDKCLFGNMLIDHIKPFGKKGFIIIYKL